MAKSKDLTELEAQAEFQRDQLIQCREKLADEPFTIKYYTAGGNTRYCENPEWLAYEKIHKSYLATLRAIAAQTGGKVSEKETGIGSPLLDFEKKYSNVRVIKSA